MRVIPFTMTGAGLGGLLRTCGETTGIVVMTCEPWALAVVRITPGACDVITTALPREFVVVMRMFAMALAAATGIAVEAWLLRPGMIRWAALFAFPSGDEGDEAPLAAWSSEGETLLLSSCGDGEFGAGAGDVA